MKGTLLFKLALLYAYYCYANRKPNIIYYLVDDLGYGEFLDNPLIDTPNLRQFASEGRVLKRTYTNTVCSPTRWEILTGSNEVRGNGVDGVVPIPAVTLPRALQNNSYYTGVIGKYGPGDANSISSARKMGFDYSYIYPTHISAHTTFPSWLEENGRRINFPNNALASRSRCTRINKPCSYAPDLFLQKSMEFLEQNAMRPFFLLWSPNLPHVGHYRSREERMYSPVTIYGAYSNKPWTIDQRGHAAMITYYIDRDIGILIKKLQDLGIDGDTLILFTSDNGPERILNIVERFKANRPLRGVKREMYDGGIRVPAMVRWPGHIPAGSFSEYPWRTQYLLPTFTKLAGNKVTKEDLVAVDQVWIKGDEAARDIDQDFMTVKNCERNKAPCIWARYDLREWPRKIIKTLDNGNGVESYEIVSDESEQINLLTSSKQQDNYTIDTVAQDNSSDHKHRRRTLRLSI